MKNKCTACQTHGAIEHTYGVMRIWLCETCADIYGKRRMLHRNAPESTWTDTWVPQEEAEA